MSKILVVDDEKGVREAIHYLLTEDGYNIDIATDGLEALNCVKNKKYDLVLTDIRMPNMNGLTLMERINEQYQKEIPVILLTACGSIESAVKAMKNGASDYIIKPFDIEHLRRIVNIALKDAPKKNEIINCMNDEQFLKCSEITKHKLDQAIYELADAIKGFLN